MSNKEGVIRVTWTVQKAGDTHVKRVSELFRGVNTSDEAEARVTTRYTNGETIVIESVTQLR